MGILDQLPKVHKFVIWNDSVPEDVDPTLVVTWEDFLKSGDGSSPGADSDLIHRMTK